jgi:hypothetical protein
MTDMVMRSFTIKDKNIKKTRLPVSIRIDPSASMDPGLKVIGLRITLTNRSDIPIHVTAEHEWHGGIWAPTDVYTLVSPRGQTTNQNGFVPVYLAGESYETAKPTTIAPGKSTVLTFRMDWPGTGSCPASPLMASTMGNRYKVRFLLVFKATDTRQYVVTKEVDVKAGFK